jgi:hypothetical protein
MDPVPKYQNRRGLLGRRGLDLGLWMLSKAILLLKCKPICRLELLLRVARLVGPRAAAACEEGKRKDAGEEINAKAQGRKDAGEEEGGGRRTQRREGAREEEQEGSGSRVEIRLVGFLCFLAG